MRLPALPRLDLHLHSAASDGEGGLPEIIARAEKTGLAVVAITDHYDPRDPRYHHLAPGCLDAILHNLAAAHGRGGGRRGVANQGPGLADWIPGLAAGRPRVLVGLERGPLAVPALPAGLFPVIGSVHYLTRAYRPADPARPDLFDPEYWRLYQEDALRLAADPQVHILGHLAGYLPLEPLLPPVSTYAERRAWEREIARRHFSRAWYEAVFREAVRTGKAIELHSATRTPGPDEVRLGLKLGVRFSPGSDAHSLERVGDTGWALDLLESLGATPTDLIPLPHPS